MDRVVIDEKIESLRRCIMRVENTIPDSAESLKSNLDVQDVVVLNLTRAIQICVDIGSHVISESETRPPTTMGEVFSSLADMGLISDELSSSMRKAVGFRNVAVHAYEDLNLEIVFAIATIHLKDFRDFAAAMDGVS